MSLSSLRKAEDLDYFSDLLFVSLFHRKTVYDLRNDKLLNGKDEAVFEKVSNFRRFLPQVLATTVKNFLLLDIGMSVAFPAIIIPALTGISNEYNKNEGLSLTPEQASWLGSIAFICQPVGSVLSGWITDPLGRKRAMFIVNVPHLIAWFLMYNATSTWQIFLANTLLGLGKTSPYNNNFFIIESNRLSISNKIFLHRCWFDGGAHFNICR